MVTRPWFGSARSTAIMGTTPSKLNLPFFNSIFEIFGQFGVWPIIGLQGFDFVNWVSFWLFSFGVLGYTVGKVGMVHFLCTWSFWLIKFYLTHKKRKRTKKGVVSTVCSWCVRLDFLGCSPWMKSFQLKIKNKKERNGRIREEVSKRPLSWKWVVNECFSTLETLIYIFSDRSMMW